MPRTLIVGFFASSWLLAAVSDAADRPALEAALKRELIGASTAMDEAQQYADARV